MTLPKVMQKRGVGLSYRAEIGESLVSRIDRAVKSGLGWEDIAVRFDLSREDARRTVFGDRKKR